nr:MAG TPA: hypothetical protein [Bacteriophage sp.]
MYLFLCMWKYKQNRTMSRKNDKIREEKGSEGK